MEEEIVTNENEIQEQTLVSLDEDYTISGKLETKINHSTEFKVNLKHTYDDYQVNILDPNNNNILFNEISEQEEDEKIYQFIPLLKGKYTITVHMNAIEKSYFIKCFTEASGKNSTVALARKTITNQENSFRLFLKNDEGLNIIDKDIEIKCKGPNSEIPVDVQVDFHLQTTNLVFTPTENGFDSFFFTF
jgi:hypothetical protein